MARVTVSLAGAPGGGIYATLRAIDDEGGMQGCGSNGSSCSFHPVASGQTFTLEVGGATCAKQMMTISPAPGSNTIPVHCDPSPAAPEVADAPVPEATATSE